MKYIKHTKGEMQVLKVVTYIMDKYPQALEDMRFLCLKVWELQGLIDKNGKIDAELFLKFAKNPYTICETRLRIQTEAKKCILKTTDKMQRAECAKFMSNKQMAEVAKAVNSKRGSFWDKLFKRA